MNREDFTHFTPLTVRWGDADLLGHINNTEFLRYLESGRIEYCHRVLDILYQRGLKQAFILADVQCTFLDQLHYPSDIEIATRVSRIGNSSAELQEAIFLKDSMLPAATSRSVIVWFDFLKQTSQSIPKEIREKILAYESLKPDC